MDGSRFDELTRALAGRSSRRGIIGGLVAAASYALAGSPGHRAAALAATKPTLISGPAVRVTSTTAEITWKTDLPSSSRVDFGPTTSYGTRVADATPRLSHRITLASLNRGERSHYRVRSGNDAGSVSSIDRTFKTLVSGPSVTDSTASSAVIKWTTADTMSSRVEFRIQGSGTGLTGTGPSGTRTSHAVKLRNLAPSTTYEYRVRSKNDVREIISRYRAFTTGACGTKWSGCASDGDCCDGLGCGSQRVPGGVAHYCTTHCTTPDDCPGTGNCSNGWCLPNL